MGTLARYRKPGGFLQLVSLLEGLENNKREHLLKLIKEEDSRWHRALESKILTFEQILTWSDSTWKTVLEHAKPLTIGTAMCGLGEEQIQRLRALLPASSRLEVKDVLTYDSPSPGKVLSARLQMAQLVRQLTVDGHLQLKTIAPDLVIPDDIEEDLAGSVVRNPSAPTKPAEKPAPDLRTREELLSQAQKLEAENQLLRRQIQLLTSELEGLKGARRQAA